MSGAIANTHSCFMFYVSLHRNLVKPRIDVYDSVYAHAQYAVWVHLRAPQCSSLWKWQLVSRAVCVWPGPLVCGQKTDKLPSGAITALTVRRVSVENMAP